MNRIVDWGRRLSREVLKASSQLGDSSSLIGDRLRLGIASRLLLAFVGVGALVLAANFIVEQEVLIERTTEITRTVPAPVMIAASPTLAAAPLPRLEPELVPVPVEHRVVTSEALLLAIDRFGEALQERAHTRNDGADTRYRKASADLKRAERDFTVAATSISGRSFRKLDAAVTAYIQSGDLWVDRADRRGNLTTQYATALERLNARAKASLAGSWKIFGRVLAKQSLLQLSSDLDSLRRHALAFSSADSADAAALSGWKTAEEAVAKDVTDNKASLQRSEGAAWLEAVHGDLVALSALRDSLAEIQGQFDQSALELAEQTAALTKVTPAKVETAALPSAPRKSKKADDAPETPVTAAPILAMTTDAAIVPTLAAPIVETHQTSRESPETHRRRLEIAWISVGAVLLLIYVAAGTVLGIVRPVRRLMRASAQLAKGDTSARVKRGGINELDRVAAAFNAMAEELAISRASTQDYQQSLELKVVERTQQLQMLAERDPLTDLPNRRQLFSLLRQAIDQARVEGKQVGVFFLDIDNFKNINDGMGHAFGDRVLIGIAERLRVAVESFGFAARLGGDEFTVVFADCPTTEAIRSAGISIVQAFQQPLHIDGRELIVSVSVGASIFPDHEQDPEALLKAADAALFRAKTLGRSQLSVFTPELLEAAAAKFLTEQGLRRAIARGEFELAFQPEVCAETLQTALVEALIRWRMPDGSLASPGQFLAIAEESGLIMDISDWVMKSAVEAAAHWYHGAWPDAPGRHQCRAATTCRPELCGAAGRADEAASTSVPLHRARTD